MIASAAQMTMRAVVRHATPDDIPAIVNFNKIARTSMFPMLDSTSHNEQADRELATFQQTYLEHPDGAFLTARVDGILVATVGYVPYDNRFAQLQIGQERIVEVVRLYVDPALHRTGLASQLSAALEKMARQKGIKQLYLHTHPFLPGAVSFWGKRGFSTIHVDHDPVWRTIHMELFLDGRGCCPKP